MYIKVKVVTHTIVSELYIIQFTYNYMEVMEWITSRLSLYSDTSNNLLIGEVEIVSSPNNATVNCTFLCEFIGCEVQYGTDPTYMNLPFSDESNKSSIAGNSVTVVLREQLNSSTMYYFTVSAVSGDVTVRVLGNFTTPQNSMLYSTCANILWIRQADFSL